MSCASTVVPSYPDVIAPRMDARAETPVDTVDATDALDARRDVQRDVYRFDVRPFADVPNSCQNPASGAITMRYVVAGDPQSDCTIDRPADAQTTSSTRIARVTAVSEDESGLRAELDFCGPGNCEPIPGSLELGIGSRLFETRLRPIVVGQLLQIRARVSWPTMSGCAFELEVTNLAAWNGVANPIRSDETLLAAATNESLHVFDDSTFAVSNRFYECAGVDTRCPPGTSWFAALLFHGRCSTCESDPPPLDLGQWHAGTFAVDGVTYAAFNAHSIGDCGNEFDYSWVVREAAR